MSLIDILGLVLSVIGVVTGIGAVVEQYRSNPRAVVRSLQLMAIYIVYAGLGIAFAALVLPGPQSSETAATAVVFIFAWIGFGLLWLLRLVPREAPLSPWIARRWSLPDYALVAVIVVTGWLLVAG
jgi:uncharacterized membrane protein